MRISNFILGIQMVLTELGLRLTGYLKDGHKKDTSFKSVPAYEVDNPLRGIFVSTPMGQWGTWWHWHWDEKQLKWIRGQKDGKGQHKGYDFAAPEGSPVYSSLTGCVEYCGWEIKDNKKRGFGIYIRMEHKDGSKSYYGHLKTYCVKVGERILKGQKIGLSGNTGSSTGPHLHFEIRKNGQPKPIHFNLY